jgi:hypothetical protein
VDTVPVEVARIPDRDELLHVLKQHGLEARAVDSEDWLGLEIPCAEDDDEERACADMLHRVETLLAETGLPLVPVVAGRRIVLRPPAS